MGVINLGIVDQTALYDFVDTIKEEKECIQYQATLNNFDQKKGLKELEKRRIGKDFVYSLTWDDKHARWVFDLETAFHNQKNNIETFEEEKTPEQSQKTGCNIL